MTFILGIWRQKYIEELSWHNPKESCLYFRIKLENKIILCTLFFPLIFKVTNLWNEFSVFFFPRKSTSVRKIFPSWLHECLWATDTVCRIASLICVLVQKYLFIMMLCKWLSSVKEIKRSYLCYWECENDCLLKAVLLHRLTHPWVIWSFGPYDWWQKVWLLKINNLFSLFSSLAFNCFYLHRRVNDKLCFLTSNK